MKKKMLGFLLFLFLVFSTNLAVAIDFDFDGTFTNDNDIVMLDFTVGSDSTITIFSSSWQSGDSGLGFDPVLAIWDDSDTLKVQQDDGKIEGSTLSNGVLYDYGRWDSFLEVNLTAGDYRASIAQYSNFASGTNLSDGFWYDDNPDFTFDLGFGSAPLFNGDDLTGTRTGYWEFHILNVAAAEGPGPAHTPEPATVALLGIGLAGLAGAEVRRRRKKNAVDKS